MVVMGLQKAKVKTCVSSSLTTGEIWQKVGHFHSNFSECDLTVEWLYNITFPGNKHFYNIIFLK